MGDILNLVKFLLENGIVTIPVILWMCWAWHNWRIFQTKEGEKPNKASQRRLNWLQQDQWSALYINWLSALLNKVSAVIGDDGKGSDNQFSRRLGGFFGFDHNPWTEPSFNLLLRIALVYPLLSFIVFWLMGGSGNIGDYKLLPSNADLSESLRWGIGIAVFLGLFGLYFLMRYLCALSGWKAVITLGTAVFLLLLIGNEGDFDQTIWDAFLIFLVGVVFLLVGGILGCAISWFFLRDWKEVIKQVRTTMWDIAVAVAVAVAVAFAFAGDGFSAFAVAVAFALALALASTFTFTFAFAGAFAFAFAVAVVFVFVKSDDFGLGFSTAEAIAIAGAIAILYQNIQTRLQTGWFWLVLAGLSEFGSVQWFLGGSEG